ncbi:MAG: hypothetical protein LBH75_08925 [Treponema sp.]|nr:hypothetical protein [Treponema sp.]
MTSASRGYDSRISRLRLAHLAATTPASLGYDSSISRLRLQHLSTMTSASLGCDSCHPPSGSAWVSRVSPMAGQCRLQPLRSRPNRRSLPACKNSIFLLALKYYDKICDSKQY